MNDPQNIEKTENPHPSPVNPERVVETDGTDAMERGSQSHRGFEHQVPPVAPKPADKR